MSSYRLGNLAVAILKFSSNGFQDTVDNMYQLPHRSTDYKHHRLPCVKESFLHGNSDKVTCFQVIWHRHNGR